MAVSDKVTVDKVYLDALLRRADFHTSTQLLGRPDPANVTVSKVEYESLLRLSREYELLKNALFQGGITGETLDLLISGAGAASANDQRKDSATTFGAYDQLFPDQSKAANSASLGPERFSSCHDDQRKPSNASHSYKVPLGMGGTGPNENHQFSVEIHGHNARRHASYGVNSSGQDDAAFDEDESVNGDVTQVNGGPAGNSGSHERRTLYFNGFSERTTYRDLLSVIKGGMLLSVNLRPERSATVTFLDGASDFLSWTKKNDIYLQAKRIEVKWADRQFHLNGHVSNKIANGATRNLVIHSALDKGLTDSQIRDDMEHIHNLIIIDIRFRNADAYISMNSVHNALFARTCMMSRSTYKGCKIEFFRDECDVPLPSKPFASKSGYSSKTKKKEATVVNRFNMLNMDGSDVDSDVENRLPVEDESDDDTMGLRNISGVSLMI